MNIQQQIKRHKRIIKSYDSQIAIIKKTNPDYIVIGVLLSKKQDSINQIDKLKEIICQQSLNSSKHKYIK